MKLNSKLKSHCRVCNHETNHNVKALKSTGASSEEFSFSEEYAIVQCLGCDSIAFRKEYYDSESYTYNENDYDQGITVNVYPAIIKSHKRLDNQWHLPAPISLMYNESIDALTAGCKTLAGVGFRAVIEAVCLNKQITDDDLETKINKLAKKHYITPNEKSRLHAVRFLGNDSIHEMKTPKEDQLVLVLQIIENLLSSIYLIDAQVQDTLESVITNYEEFKSCLSIAIRRFKSGDKATLYKLFGKDVRRIKEHGQEFENQLVAEIQAGAFTALAIASVVPSPGVTASASPVFFIL